MNFQDGSYFTLAGVRFGVYDITFSGGKMHVKGLAKGGNKEKRGNITMYDPHGEVIFNASCEALLPASKKREVINFTVHVYYETMRLTEDTTWRRA